ncbi:MAG: class I SAM-dependent methyltransferase [Telluria sp.]
MSSDSIQSAAPVAMPARAPKQSVPSSAAVVLRLLEKIRHGTLQLRTPGGEHLVFGAGGVPVTLELRNWRVFGAAMRSGDIGFAESYIAGDWHTNNLPALLELLANNRAQVESALYGSWWGRLAYRVRHLLNRNSRTGSRKNIHAHYDIGNAFYKLWLDSSMTYSSALFTAASGADLTLAQAEKYRAVLRQLRLDPGQRVLEIGCGWGGFAEIAAREGMRVTGLTLSEQQLAYATQRMQDAGLAHMTQLKLCDYRDSDGEYDAIASIEMFEAVGEAYWPSYFECIARNLKRGGRACVQTIVIADELFERYRKGTDFIQQYVFPGGMLPSPQVFTRMAGECGLTVTREFSFGADYADTLAAWRSAFHARLDAVREQGFDERFIRTWDFYLAYCEAAFRARNTSVMHFTLEKV